MKPFTAVMMEDTIATAEHIISKWDVHADTSLFHDTREDSRAFLAAVADLKHAMNSLASRTSTSHHLLARAHKLVESAMARLQKEFHRILSAARALDDSPARSLASLSLSDEALTDDTAEDADEDVRVMPPAAMDDLRAIAGCMVECGYTRECVKVYTAARRPLVEEGLRRLGNVKMSPSQVHRLDWEVEERVIRSWVAGSRPAVRSLLAGEWFLCDYVFVSSEAAKESVFVDIAKEPALQYLHFPEVLCAKTKNTPEKIFHFLDMYDAMAELSSEIETLFSRRSTAAVAQQARNSLAKLGDFIQSSFVGFESAIQKDPVKGTVPGGGLHPLTRYVMNYLGLLADYSEVLGEILADHPLVTAKPLAEPFAKLLSPVNTAPNSPARGEVGEAEPPSAAPPAVSARVAWLVLLLLCKLDGKAEAYGDAALSYLFLANNVRYVVEKVRTSSLRHLLGEEWVRSHGEKARSFARSYERLGWRRVVEAVPEGPVGAGEARERMTEFSAAFEEAYRKQSGWVVKDRWLRDELKVSIAGKVMVPYREFYHQYIELMRKEKVRVGFESVRFTPEDIGNYLSDLFYGDAAVSSSSGSSRSHGSGSGSGSGSSGKSRWRSN